MVALFCHCQNFVSVKHLTVNGVSGVAWDFMCSMLHLLRNAITGKKVPVKKQSQTTPQSIFRSPHLKQFRIQHSEIRIQKIRNPTLISILCCK